MVEKIVNGMSEPKKLPKLVVQIPAYNEEETIGKVIKEIPRKISGVSEVIVLVIDDGSTDSTVEVAKKSGADYVYKNTKNLGLAKTFQKGINIALKLKADILVNTDADFQYNQAEIPKLIKPILERRADIVSGDRQIEKLNHMVSAKKYGNIIGSKIVRIMGGNGVKDASSGFRAYNKEAMRRLFVISDHTYTHQTLIQANNQDLKVIEVPVEFRKRKGHSKLIKSIYSHVKRSSSTIVRTNLMYNSMKTLSYIGVFLIILGAVPIIRWIYLSYVIHDSGNHIQSLLLGSLLIIAGGMSVLLGFISDLIAINRRYLEEVLYKLRKMEKGE